MEPIIDDVFTNYERLERISVAQITEENIPTLARLFGWQADYCGDKPTLVKPNDVHGYGGREFHIGEYVINTGDSISSSRVRDWAPAGTYEVVDR